jgi:hypothetical protein
MPTALLIQYVSELAASEQLQTSSSRKAFIPSKEDSFKRFAEISNDNTFWSYSQY